MMSLSGQKQEGNRLALGWDSSGAEVTASWSPQEQRGGGQEHLNEHGQVKTLSLGAPCPMGGSTLYESRTRTGALAT